MTGEQKRPNIASHKLASFGTVCTALLPQDWPGFPGKPPGLQSCTQTQTSELTAGSGMSATSDYSPVNTLKSFGRKHSEQTRPLRDFREYSLSFFPNHLLPYSFWCYKLPA